MDQFVCPQAVVGRKQITTELPWSVVGGTLDSPEPLTDDNVWLIGFTTGVVPRAGMLSSVEHGGSQVFRDFMLIRNSDGAILLNSVSRPQNAPGFGFVAHRMGSLDHRIVLAKGERYTFALWNHDPGQSSAMRAELYL